MCQEQRGTCDFPLGVYRLVGVSHGTQEKQKEKIQHNWGATEQQGPFPSYLGLLMSMEQVMGDTCVLSAQHTVLLWESS